MMGWFRSNRGGVAWLAFFALACQLLLSFGHVHLGKIDLPAAAMALSVDGGQGQAGLPQSPDQNAPSKKAPSVPADFCAICANIGLASTLVAPDAPILIEPKSFTQILPWTVVAIAPVAFDHLPFSARGPPQA